jgi:radical SAM protein with 4Fe4S-binding SPASM domain
MKTKTKKEKDKEKLIDDWSATYKKVNKHESCQNFDYESLCVGWCVAKGLTVDDALDFYQDMIPLKLY